MMKKEELAKEIAYIKTEIIPRFKFKLKSSVIGKLLAKRKYKKLNRLMKKWNTYDMFVFCVNIIRMKKQEKLNDFDFSQIDVEKLVDCLLEGVRAGFRSNHLNIPEIIYELAKVFPNAPIDKLAEVLSKIKYAESIYKFVKEIPNAPIEMLAQAIIETKDTYWICKFVQLAKEIPNIPLNKFKEFAIETKNVKLICVLAKEMPNAPIEEFTRVVIEKKNAPEIFEFAKLANEISDIPVDKLAQTIIEIKDAKCMIEFAKEVPNAPVNDLLKEFMKSNYDYKLKAELIYDFAKNAPNAPMELLAQCMVETKYEYYIYQFLQEIPNAPKDILVQALVDMNSLYYVFKLIEDLATNSLELSLESINKIFGAIIKIFGIGNRTFEEKTQLMTNLLAEVFDEESIKLFLGYLINGEQNLLENTDLSFLYNKNAHTQAGKTKNFVRTIDGMPVPLSYES